MTNEQLAQLIGQGGNDELLPILWEKMRRLYSLWSDRYYRLNKERCDTCGVMPEDLKQERYLALLESVRAYANRPAEQENNLFTSYCFYPFKNHAAQLTGIRQGRNEPLNRPCDSLDRTLTDKEGDTDTTVGDLIPDNEAEKPFREIEQSDFCRKVREQVAAVLTEKPTALEVIERRYYKGETLTEIAADMGVTGERVRQLEREALRLLRKSKALQNFCEISFFNHTSLGCFRRSGCSSVERIAERREKRWGEVEQLYRSALKRK